MRLPNSAHTSQPWRIHEFTNDFEVEDVWELPTPGEAHDFPRLVQLMSSFDPSQRSLVVRGLFELRWKLGGLLGLDGEETGLDARVPTLRDRLPADLRHTRAPTAQHFPFRSLYLIEDEWAGEIANRTMHGVLHLGWVLDGSGSYRGQMTVLVKRNGLIGTVYMAAIRPLRQLLVYPSMLQQLERAWGRGSRPAVPVVAAR